MAPHEILPPHPQFLPPLHPVGTNVIQSIFARRSILYQLNLLKLASSDDRISMNLNDYKPFEKIYRSMWANNANALALSYASGSRLEA